MLLNFFALLLISPFICLAQDQTGKPMVAAPPTEAQIQFAKKKDEDAIKKQTELLRIKMREQEIEINQKIQEELKKKQQSQGGGGGARD